MQKFNGLSGKENFENILSGGENRCLTKNNSFGYFEEIFTNNGKFFIAIIPRLLVSDEYFYGEIKEISLIEYRKYC